MKSFKHLLLSLVLLCSCVLGFGQYVRMEHGTINPDYESFYYVDPDGQNANYQDTGIYIVNTVCSSIYDDPSGGANFQQSWWHINFTEFALGMGDTLYIYDGDDLDAPLIGAYNGANSPGDIYTNSGCVTFVFVTDGIADLQGMNAGWKASFSPYFADERIVRLGYSHPTGTNLTTCNARFYDSGGANGGYTAAEIPSDGLKIVFTADGGQHIKAEKVSFNLGSGTIMEIYDGNIITQSTTARRIGHFKGGYPPPEILISSGASLSFKISGGGSGAGWDFEISCVPEIYEQEEGASGCPEIVLYNRDSMDVALGESLDFNCETPMLMLYAKVNVPGDVTADYTVKSIPYNPPFPFHSGGLTPVPTDIDDTWLPVVNLPYTFMYYGQPYSNLYPGTNGAVSFTPRSGHEAWSYTVSMPNTTAADYAFIPSGDHKNSAFLVFQDTYPGAGNPPQYSGIWHGQLGAAPCRTYVLSCYRLPQFSCTSDNLSTYQMVFYEGTNIIDVYVERRTVCNSWNDGNGVIGVLSQQGNMAVVPPGRNTGNWTVNVTPSDHDDASDHPEAWRFTPISPISSLDNIKWYKNSVSPENEIANNNGDKRLITLFPEETTTYIVQLQFEVNGTPYTVSDSIEVKVEMPPFEVVSSDSSICPNTEVTLTVNALDPDDQERLAQFQWFTGNEADTTRNIIVTPSESTSYMVQVTYDNKCQNTDSVRVTVECMEWPVIVGDTLICEGEKATLTATEVNGDVTWSTGEHNLSINVSPTETKEYRVSVTSENGCITDDTITVNVNPRPTAGFAPNPQHVFVEDGQGTINFVNLSTDADSYSWNFGDRWCIPGENVTTDSDPAHIYTHAGHYDVTLTVATEAGCMDSVTQTVIVEVPYFYYIPNAFTPNNDGVNDVFITSGEGLDMENFEMLIFDRFGQIIFKTQTPYDYWDGRDRKGRNCPMGEYVYKITAHDMDGFPKVYTGTVMLIR